VCLTLAGTACGSTTAVGNGGNVSHAVPTPADTRYSVAGPYAAGTMRVTLADGDGAQLWYPVAPGSVTGKPTYSYRISSWLPASLAAEPDLAVLDDPAPTDSYEDAPIASDTSPGGDPDHAFPVVLFSHGSASYPEQSSFLMDHLASWGFVVAAPDHRSDDLAAKLLDTPTSSQGDPDVVDLDTTLAYLQAADSDTTSMFDGKVDLTRVGVVGQASGGQDAITLAAEVPEVGTYVALAPTGGTPPTTHTPGLVVYAGNDNVVAAADVQQLYSALPTPKRLIVLVDAGHNVFTDFCGIGGTDGRLVDRLPGAAKDNEELGELVSQFTDGCSPPDLSPAEARPLIDQATTAQLRYGLRLDPEPVGLDTGLDGAYPGVVAVYYQRL